MEPKKLIKEYILSKPTPPDKQRIGVEVECLIYDQNGRRIPVNKGPKPSAQDFLEELECCQREDNPKAWYSLEPGGQIEWASPPEPDLFAIKACLDRHNRRMKVIRREFEMTALDYSLDPIYHPDDVELIHVGKYEIMDALFRRTDTRGPWMMRNSTSVQINLDYTSEDEATEMAFLADALVPFAAVLFSNSPFTGGRPAGHDNLRQIIWSHTDRNRSGSLWQHGMNDPEKLIDQYSAWAANVPLIFTPDGENKWTAPNQTGAEWLNSLSVNEWPKAVSVLLHHIFTHIRFKNVLEIRGNDRPPFGYELTPPAWWLGLLGDPNIRGDLMKRVRNWSAEERNALEFSAMSVDTEQPGPENHTLDWWIHELSARALDGLRIRSKAIGEDESVFLKPFLEKVYKEGPFTLSRQKEFAKSGKSLDVFISDQYRDRD